MNKLLGLLSMCIGKLLMAVEIVSSVQKYTDNMVLLSGCILIYGGLFLTTAWATAVAMKLYYNENYRVPY